MTRAMFVTTLARLDGANVNNNAATDFSDVPKGTWYTGSVSWAAKNHLVNGTSTTTFSPDAPVTREDMIVMIIRYTDFLKITLPESKAIDTFTDQGQISTYAESSVNNAVKANLVVGFADGRFGPKATSTRAQVATVISRAKSLIDIASSPNPSKLIDAASAKSIALQHAGLT